MYAFLTYTLPRLAVLVLLGMIALIGLSIAC